MKAELNEMDLGNVIGGKIEFTWDNNNGGSGTIWISARNPIKFSFTNYGVVDYCRRKQNEGWSDQEIIDELKANNHIW